MWIVDPCELEHCRVIAVMVWDFLCIAYSHLGVDLHTI